MGTALKRRFVAVPISSGPTLVHRQTIFQP
jgi:hypothetical protein